MTIEIDVRRGRQARHRHETVEFRLFYAATFLVFLPTVCLLRLWPSHWFERSAGARAHPSIIDDARARTDRIVPFVFMG